MRQHPDQKTISDDGKGPAIITYKDGTQHHTFDLAYTTALKYETPDGRSFTAKGSAIRHIEWVSLDEIGEVR